MADNEPEPEKIPSMENPDPSTGNSSFREMIMASVRALDEPNGSSKAAISKYIESNYPNANPSDSTLLLQHHLRMLKEDGSLFMEKHSYKLPSESQGSEPNSVPVKRGRGRPPKPKTGVPPAGLPRPRGRPPKPKVGVLSPVGTSPSQGRPPKEPKLGGEATGSPRPRGRPRKVGGNAAVPAGGTRRPRGRPPKPKDPSKPSVSQLPKGSRPRGRPRKAEISTAREAPSSFSAAVTHEVPPAH